MKMTDDMQPGQPPCRVLVVEDHHDSAILTSRVLQADGYEVAVVHGYEPALSAARANRFDAIVCDVGLPDGDGCRLLEEVRALYPVRAVAVTGYGMPIDRARCEAAGFNRFLLKPITLDQLREAVGDATEGLDCHDPH